MVGRRKFHISQGLIYLLLTVISLLCILPMLLVLIVSFTDESCIGRYGYSLIPKKLSLAAYEKLFYPGSSIYASCGITVFITVVGTVIAVLITFMVAYPETKSQGLFHQIQKEVTFCGLLHGAYA